MAKTKKVGKRRNLRKKQNSRRQVKAKGYEQMVPAYLAKMLNKVSLDTYNREFVDSGNPSVVSRILSHLPKRDVKGAIHRADKAEYERRVLAAIPLNEKILKTQEAEIKRLEMSGIDGPAQRTRSKAKPATNPVLEELRLEAYHSDWVLMQLQRIAQRIRDGENTVPYGYRDYGEFLRGDPAWDMERMGYVKRFRPPGYQNYDKTKGKSKA